MESMEKQRAQGNDTVLFYQSPPDGACGLVLVWSYQKQTWLGLPMPIEVGFSRVAKDKQHCWGEPFIHRVLQLQQRKRSRPNSLTDQGFSTSALLTLRAGEFSVVGAVLFMVGCLAAVLASTHKMPVAYHHPQCGNHKYPRHHQMPSGGPNHPQLRIAALDV